MGTVAKVVLFSPDKPLADSISSLAFEEISRIENILSDYKVDSEVNNLTKIKHSRNKIKVSKDLWEVLRFGNYMSEISYGNFDITCGYFTKLWRECRENGRLPTTIELDKAKNKVGHRLIEYHPKSKEIRFLSDSIQLDFGGIAKGYASGKALEVIEKAGIRKAFVDLGGDIVFNDSPPKKTSWTVGLSLSISDAMPKYVYLNLKNESVATSGSLYNNFNLNGIKYSHIVNPKTGIGLTANIQVTIIAPSGMKADSYASAVSVLGFSKGRRLIENSQKIEGIIIEEKYGNTKWWASKGFLKKCSLKSL